MAATPGTGEGGGEPRQETPMETDGLDVTTPQRSNDDLPGRGTEEGRSRTQGKKKEATFRCV